MSLLVKVMIKQISGSSFLKLSPMIPGGGGGGGIDFISLFSLLLHVFCQPVM